MSVLSYVHQLFNVNQCQAYIHTLRWKDRPLQCPRCQSRDVDPWGTYHYRPGCKRYCCNGCQRTFNDLTNTLLHQSRRSLPHWILATFLLCLSCSSRRIARALGVHSRTSYRWCWWLRNTAMSYEMDRQLEGTVEADDLYHIAGHKGQAKQGGPKLLGRPPRGRRKKCEPGRGNYDKDRPAIIAWISRQGAVVLHTTKDFTIQTVQKAANVAVQAGSRLYTDSARSYQALKGYWHEFVNHTKKEGIRAWGRARESRGVSVLLAQALLAGLSGLQQNQPPRICGLLSILAERAASECVRAGGTHLTSGIRPRGREQGEKGRVCPMPGSF